MNKLHRLAAKYGADAVIYTVIICLSVALTGIGLLIGFGNPLTPKSDAFFKGMNWDRAALESPAFNPLVHNRSSAIRSSEAKIIYDGPSDVSIRSGASDLWDFDYQPWWKSDDSVDFQTQESERIYTPKRLSSGVTGENHYSWTRAFQSQGNKYREGVSDIIAMGVADLLGNLKDADTKRMSLDHESSANPFQEAIKEDEKKLTAEKTASAKEDPEPPKSDASEAKDKGNSSEQPPSNTAGEVTISSGSAKTNFLFIGNGSKQKSVSVQPAIRMDGEENSFEFPGLETQSFELSIVQRTKDGRESVTFGDLNGDGIWDLIVTNKGTSKAYIYLGSGNGRYEFYTDLSGGIGASSATIGDFNNDGSMDVAVAYLTDKRIVIDGKGLRKFIFFPTSNTNEQPYSILPHDFNDDGLEDLLVLNYDDFSASVYLNQGSTTFAPSQRMELSAISLSQVKLDLNSDSIEDLVYLEHLDDQVSLVMRDGKDNSLVSLGNFVLNPSVSLVLGDFNKDGLVDVALARK